MKQIDFTKYINNSNEIDKHKIIKTILNEPIIKYTLIGVGAILLLYGSGKIMKVVSGTIIEYKHLKQVLSQ
jgi:hypothetical protein